MTIRPLSHLRSVIEKQITGLPAMRKGEVVRTGPLVVDLTMGTAFISGERLDIALTEVVILATLASEPGRALGRTEVVSPLWANDHFLDEDSFEDHLCSLMRAVAPFSDRGIRIIRDEASCRLEV